MPSVSARRRHRRKRVETESDATEAGLPKSAPVGSAAQLPKTTLGGAIIDADFKDDDEDDDLSFSAAALKRGRGVKRPRGAGLPSAAAIAATTAARTDERASEQGATVQYSAAYLKGLQASQKVLGSSLEPSEPADGQPSSVDSQQPPTASPNEPAAAEPWVHDDAGDASPIAAQHHAARVLAAAVTSAARRRLPPRGSTPFAAARIAFDAVPRRFQEALQASQEQAQQAEAQLKHFESTARDLSSQDSEAQELLGSMSAAFDTLSEAYRRMAWSIMVARAAARVLQRLQPVACACLASFRDAGSARCFGRVSAQADVLLGSGLPADATLGDLLSLKVALQGGAATPRWACVQVVGGGRPPADPPQAPADTRQHTDAYACLLDACKGGGESDKLDAGLLQIVTAAEADMRAAAGCGLPQSVQAAAATDAQQTDTDTLKHALTCGSLQEALLVLRSVGDEAVAAADATSDQSMGVTELAATPAAMLQSAQWFKQHNARAYTDTYCSMTLASLLHPAVLLHELCSEGGSTQELQAAVQQAKNMEHVAAGEDGHTHATDEANSDSTLAARGVLSAQLHWLRLYLAHSWQAFSGESTHKAHQMLTGAVADIARLSAAVTSVAPLSSSRQGLLDALCSGVTQGLTAALAHVHVPVLLPSASAMLEKTGPSKASEVSTAGSSLGGAVCAPCTLAGAGMLLQVLRGGALLDSVFPQGQPSIRQMCVEQVLGDMLLPIVCALCGFAQAQAQANSAWGGTAAVVGVQLARQIVLSVPRVWLQEHACTQEWSLALTAIGEELLVQCTSAARVAAACGAQQQLLQAAEAIAEALDMRATSLAKELLAVFNRP